jgi:large subunit ribosomal protein L20
VPRVKRGTKRKDFRVNILKAASGYFLTKSKLNRSAQEAVEKAGVYAYVGRRQKKRDFRALWITRINAACRQSGMSYSKFIAGLKKGGIDLNRKVLSMVAVDDEAGFRQLVAQSKAALERS